MRRLLLVPVFSLGLLIAASVANADVVGVTYVVDPARSSLTASGTYDGNALDTYTFGETDPPTEYHSCTTSYSGTITADRDTTGNTFQITSASVVAGDNPASIGPPAEPTSGGNYAFYYGLPSYPSTTRFDGAIRGLSFSLQSPLMPTTGTFDASDLRATFASGVVYYDWVSTTYLTSPPGVQETDGSTTLSGDLALDFGKASFLEVDGQETLTIPFATDEIRIPVSGLSTLGEGLIVQFSGNIVAVASVPEPGSLALLLAATAATAWRRRRK